MSQRTNIMFELSQSSKKKSNKWIYFDRLLTARLCVRGFSQSHAPVDLLL